MAHWKDASSETIRMAGGQASVLLLPDRVVKTAKLETLTEIAREARILTHIAGHLKTPTPLVLQDWDGTSFTMSRLPGGTMRAALMSGKLGLHDFDALALDIATFMYEFSNCFGKADIAHLGIMPWQSRFQDIPKIQPHLFGTEAIRSSPLLSRQVATILARYPYCPSSPSIVAHNDMSAVNMMWPFAVIDFGVVNRTTPENAFRNFISLPPALTLRIIDAYERLSGRELDKTALCGAMCLHLGQLLARYQTGKASYNPAPLANTAAKIIGHYFNGPVTPLPLPEKSAKPAHNPLK